MFRKSVMGLGIDHSKRLKYLDEAHARKARGAIRVLVESFGSKKTGEIIGVSASCVSRYTSGRGAPSEPVYRKALDALKVAGLPSIEFEPNAGT